MSKKVQKTLTAALATTLATGSMAIPAMAAPVGANNDLDALYKAAYEATVKTQNLDKVTQNDINVAREAINKLRGTSVASAVPTFSSIVDKAQQKFLEIAYNSIVKCQETGTQKDINTARTNIQDLPLEFKNPYSMAIDAVQQKVIDKVYAAVEEAIKTQNPKDIEKAQALLDDILTVVHNDGVKKWAVETEVRFKKATAVLNIVSAEALNNNSVRVVFNRPIDSKTATVENFSVTPKGEAYNNLYVNKVKVAEDGMSVDITTVNAFTNKGEYVVNVSGIKSVNGTNIVKDAHAEFKYEIAAVKSIEFSTKNIPLGANLKDYVLVRDALGRNVTNEYKDKLTFTSSNLNLVNENGVVTSDDKQIPQGHNTVLVGVAIDGTNINTSATLTISKSAATSFDGYTIVNKEYSIGGKTLSQVPQTDRLSYVTIGQTDAKLIVGFKDQFGKEITLDKSDFTVEKNYNSSVAIVKNDGSIQALSVGTAYVRIKSGTIERTISVTVKAASLPATIATNSDNYNLVATNTSGINIDYTINNQYGDKFTGNKDVVGAEDATKAQELTEYIVKDSSGNVATQYFDFNINKPNAKNQINITPKSNVKIGTYKLTLSKKFEYKGKTTTISKDVNINVINGGTVDGFKVQLSNNKLDVNPNNNQGTPNTATLTVYEVDAQGNELNTVKFGDGKDEASIKVFDSNGNEVDDTKIATNITNGKCVITAKDDGTYTIKVKVGTYVTKQITINVVNTDAKVSTITVDSKASTVNANQTIGNVIKDINATIKDQFGNTLDTTSDKNKSYKITGINYDLANESGVEINDTNNLSDVIKWTGKNNNGAEVNQGSFNLVVNSMTVTISEKDKKDTTKTVYFDTPLNIQVTVNKVEEAKPEITIKSDNGQVIINATGTEKEQIQVALNNLTQAQKDAIATVKNMPEGANLTFTVDKVEAPQGGKATADIKVSVVKNNQTLESKIAKVTVSTKPEQEKPEITVVSNNGQYTITATGTEPEQIQAAIAKLTDEQKAQIATVKNMPEGATVLFALDKVEAPQGGKATADIKVSVVKNNQILESKIAKVTVSTKPEQEIATIESAIKTADTNLTKANKNLDKAQDDQELAKQELIEARKTEDNNKIKTAEEKYNSLKALQEKATQEVITAENNRANEVVKLLKVKGVTFSFNGEKLTEDLVNANKDNLTVNFNKNGNVTSIVVNKIIYSLEVGK